MAKVGINGFGRTGKLLLKAMLENQPLKIKPVAINDPGLQSPKHAAHVFKFDSAHGRFYGRVCYDEKHLLINEEKILILKEADSKKISWSQSDASYIADCSGKNTTINSASQHLTGKVKKVVVASASMDIPMFVMGSNHLEYKPSEKVISIGSCGTNALAPLVKVIHEKFGIREGFVTIVHALSNQQNALDGISVPWRLGRCSVLNIIPVKTWSSEAVGRIIPDLKGKISGIGLRVPTAIGSAVDLTVRVCTKTKLADINDEIKQASMCGLSGILGYTDEEVVSSDFVNCSCSAIYDATASAQLNGRFFKLIAWFDNEYGYACRLADFLVYIADKDNECECKKNLKIAEEKSANTIKTIKK